MSSADTILSSMTPAWHINIVVKLKISLIAAFMMIVR